MLKKIYVTALFLTFFSMTGSFLFAQGNDTAPPLQILGSISLGYANNSDMNDAAKDRGEQDADYYNSLVAGDPFSADNSSANFTYGFDLDLRYFFGNFGVGAETGYHTAEAESKVSASGWEDESTTTVELTVIPVVANVFYKISAGSANSFFLIGAGVGYYSGTMEYKYEDDDTLAGDDSFTKKDKNSAMGCNALVEYDFVLDNGITFFTGVKARYVEFDKFEDEGFKISDGGSLTGVNWYIGAGVSI